MVRRTALALLLLLPLAASCGPARYTISRELTAPGEMREILLAQVPPGTLLRDAQATMEANQFSCEVVRGKRFLTAEFEHTEFDYLYCRRTDKAGFLVVRCWQVALALEDGRVTDVMVNVGYVGP